jgi:hypothetical protein
MRTRHKELSFRRAGAGSWCLRVSAASARANAYVSVRDVSVNRSLL